MAKLRERDALLDVQLSSYRDLINNLHRLLTANGIAIPDHLRLPQTLSPQAKVTFINDGDGSQSLQATMPTFQEFRQQQQQDQEGFSPEMVLSGTETSDTSDMGNVERKYTGRIENLNISQQQYDLNNAAAYVSPDPMSTKDQKGRASQFNDGTGNFDTAQAAVDFVLALEKPCLAHHPADFDNLEADSNGHSLMLQAPLLSRQPNRSQTTLTTAPPNAQPAAVTQAPATTWNVPAFEIEKLLSLSDRLSLDGELTPVEAWQRLRQHPGFASMTYVQLEGLRDVLLSNVKCYGFGAVLEEDYFDLILQQALGGPTR